MVEQLFGSKTRVKLLKLFYTNPNRSYYVRELTRKINEQINSVRRELANLLSIGIISSDNNNNKLYYEVNRKYEHYNALSSIFDKTGAKNVNTVLSTNEGVVADNDELVLLQKVGNVELAAYTGQFTRDEVSGIDFLIVGDINSTKLNRYISELEAKENKEIRFVSMSSSEYNYRDQVNDRFLNNFKQSKKQIVIDKHNRFKE